MIPNTGMTNINSRSINTASQKGRWRCKKGFCGLYERTVARSGFRNYCQTHRLKFIAVMAAFAIAVLWVVVAALRPMPPHTLTMVTGPEGRAYHEFGKRYGNILARDGIDLRLLSTAGAMENLMQLQDSRSGVDVGFLQSGTTRGQGSPELESLGTVFY